jgi:hypothetical protein
VNNDPVPGASVTLESRVLSDRRRAASNDNGFFEFKDLEPGSPYHVIISAEGFASWTSDEVILKPGEYEILTVSRLRIAPALTQVNVGYSAVEIATEQVKVEEQQRIFGFIPNFYVEYDPNAAPLTTKLKFQLAAKVSYDPVTLAGVGAFAAANQAGDRPNYPQGARGYAERYGAVYADGITDIMIGGAVLPSLLHQDPRYYYQVTGKQVSRFPRIGQLLCLQGRQRKAAAELFDCRRRSGRGRALECLLPGVESRRRIVLEQFLY